MHKNVSFTPEGSGRIAHGSESMEFGWTIVSMCLPVCSKVF